MHYDATTLLIRPRLGRGEAGVITGVTPERAGWEHLHFEVRRLNRGDRWEHATGDCEYALVILGGRCAVRSNRGAWAEVGRRPDVFSGMPYALYLPRGTAFTLEAHTDDFEVAYGWCATDQDHPPRLITPADAEIEIRGGANATRQINSIIPPGFDCQRLVACEVYTPSGNWSSYPPHKHDEHQVGPGGQLLQADLEEIYFYKLDHPGGWAVQRVYTEDGRIDAAMVARDNDLILVPEGHHPVVSAYGYTTYYLNFLAGSAQSLAAVDDPAHAWVKETWTWKDPRLPIVDHGMEPRGGSWRENRGAQCSK
jgi:5-deoxy-glucuronate isomerase